MLLESPGKGRAMEPPGPPTSKGGVPDPAPIALMIRASTPTVLSTRPWLPICNPALRFSPGRMYILVPELRRKLNLWLGGLDDWSLVGQRNDHRRPSRRKSESAIVCHRRYRVWVHRTSRRLASAAFLNSGTMPREYHPPVHLGGNLGLPVCSHGFNIRAHPAAESRRDVHQRVQGKTRDPAPERILQPRLRDAALPRCFHLRPALTLHVGGDLLYHFRPRPQVGRLPRRLREGVPNAGTALGFENLNLP